MACVRFCSRPKGPRQNQAAGAPEPAFPGDGCCEGEDGGYSPNFKEAHPGGQYEIVPQYKYVGKGNGDLMKVGEGTDLACGCSKSSLVGNRCFVPILGLFTVLVAIVVLALLFSPLPTFTTTTVMGPSPDLLPSSGVALGPGAPTVVYDCGWSQPDVEPVIWSQDQRVWCCFHHNIGCSTPAVTTTEPYDCQAGLSDWEAGWADGKKEWCCTHTGQGCPRTTPDAYDCSGPTLDWAFGRRYWCCWHRGAGCNKDTGRHFETTMWPSQAAAGGAPGLAPPAPAPQADDPNLPYDCEAGYTTWQRSWSDSKKSWCCQNAGVACSGDATASSTI